MSNEKELVPEEGASPEDSGEEAVSAEGAEDELTATKRKLVYLAAEFDNYKKRTARERETLIAFGNERLLLALLPVIDNLERALTQGAGIDSAGSLLSGVRMTHDLFLAELKKFGVEPIDAKGASFDPSRHEAIARVPAPGAVEGTVVDEARRGYMLNGRLLRPAQVTVAIGADADGGAGR